MTDQDDKVRYEKNFEALFCKTNKALSINIFIAVITTLVIVGGSLFGLMYSDLQDFKSVSTATATEQRIEVIKELGELKVLVKRVNNQ